MVRGKDLGRLHNLVPWLDGEDCTSAGTRLNLCRHQVVWTMTDLKCTSLLYKAFDNPVNCTNFLEMVSKIRYVIMVSFQSNLNFKSGYKIEFLRILVH